MLIFDRLFFFFKQKTAYEMRISDWSSDVCSSDLVLDSLLKTDPSLRPIMSQLDRSQRSRAWNDGKVTAHHGIIPTLEPANLSAMSEKELAVYRLIRAHYLAQFLPHHEFDRTVAELSCGQQKLVRSEEHTSELQSLMRIS